MQALFIKFKNYLLLFVFVLFLAYMLIWWVIAYQFTGLPEYIYPPYIKLIGVSYAVCGLIVFTVFQKLLLKKQPFLTVFQLTALSLVVAFPSTIMFIAIKPFLPRGWGYFEWTWFIECILIFALMAGLFALAEALRLKKKHRIWIWLVNAITFGLYLLLIRYINFFR